MTILQDRKTGISSNILRLVGYGLLLMMVVNISFLVIPLQSMPLWEFQTIGAIVERMPFILLAIVLVFYGEKSNRASVELSFLKLLSWLCLISAIVLLLIIPFNINNTLRIYNQKPAINNVYFVSHQDAIAQFQEQLLMVNSQEEITAIIQQQTRSIFNIPDSIDVRELKGNILIILQNYQDSITSQLQTFRVPKRLFLIKKCLKWTFGALIAAILFFLIWKNTNWARTKAL